ncbi:DOPA 45-dioxygenase [Pyrenophora seminiperda CCB06]|uniref:DOPA 45-dioxygenase n=1 Tax=Pyrenophora seminiperda CCB06 TaxID=1302712 RepID=A0A3M7LTH1_9PLEO|nr:DOPA 45-dioxygenase [Pyrenophora seminiperda CCB06]
MSDPSLYTYESPLKGYEGLEPLPNEKADDGKSYVTPAAAKKSEAYNSFVAPITNGIRGGFDIHIYFLQTDAEETKFANQLWERIRREFPELRIYRVWDKPIGPHPLAMFEVNIFTPGGGEGPYAKGDLDGAATALEFENVQED